MRKVFRPPFYYLQNLAHYFKHAHCIVCSKTVKEKKEIFFDSKFYG